MSKISLDINALASAWQDDNPDTAYYLDRQTGFVVLVQQSLYDLRDLTDEIESDRDRYLYIPKPKDGELKQDLKDFAEIISDPKLARLLSVALESPNVLCACKIVLSKEPKELARLEEFRKARTFIRIKQWLSANCFDELELPGADNTMS